MRVLLIVLAVILLSVEARATEYAEVRATMANTQQFDLPNTGWEFAVGRDFGWYRAEVVTGEHKHLGDATSAVYVMNYVEHTFGNWTPSVGAGGGYSANPGRPVAHLSVQVAYEITPEWAVTTGLTYRYYFGPFGEDGFLTAGIRRTF